MFNTESGIVNSDDGRHVYVRWWNASSEGTGVCTVIGLFPEGEGDESIDDTTRLCLEFAAKNNYRTLAVINLYSEKGLDQNNVRKAQTPVGSENDRILAEVAAESDIIIVAWGDFPWIKFRSRQVMNLLLPYTLHAVQVNANGTPSHPKAWRMKAAKLYRQSAIKAVPVAG